MLRLFAGFGVVLGAPAPIIIFYAATQGIAETSGILASLGVLATLLTVFSLVLMLDERPAADVLAFLPDFAVNALVAGICISAPVTLYLLARGVHQLWETSGALMAGCVIGTFVSLLSFALLYDSRHPPEPRQSPGRSRGQGPL